MQVAGVTGEGAEAVAATLGRQLRDRGQVVQVRAGDVSPDGGAVLGTALDGDATVVRSESGVRTTEAPRSLAAVLDELTVAYDYALITGHATAPVPHIVVGDVSFDGEVLVRLESADDPIEPVIEAIEGLAPRETLASLVAEAKASPKADRAGAIATFTGRVRERDREDDPRTTHLEFESYEDVAEAKMAELATALESREGVYEVVLHHKTGVVDAGEDIVFVVILAGHRDEAFATVSAGIDRLKAEVPLFKKEVTVEDAYWAHERE